MIHPEYHHSFKLNKAQALCADCNNAIAVSLDTITQVQLNSEQKAALPHKPKSKERAVILCKAIIVPVITNIGWETVNDILIEKWTLTYRPCMCECEQAPTLKGKDCIVYQAEQTVKRLKWWEMTFLAHKADIGERINFDPLRGPIVIPIEKVQQALPQPVLNLQPCDFTRDVIGSNAEVGKQSVDDRECGLEFWLYNGSDAK